MKRILYIAGAPHCGSTMLDIMLGAVPGVVSTGEIDNLYKRDPCACGQLPDQCPTWGPVLAAPGMPDRRQLEALSRLSQRERGFVELWASPGKCRRYAEVQDRVFDAIVQATGAHTVIDSSKYVTRAIALLRGSRYDVRVLHLIRDPRGYLNSINKRRLARGASRSYAPVVGKWLLKNAAASVVVRSIAGARYLRIRYEDLMLHPEPVLQRIGSFVEIDVADVVARITNDEPFYQQHLYAGNGIAQRDQIVFDPSRLQAMRLEGMDHRTFWYTLGWPAAFWGYASEPSYVNDASDDVR